MGERRKQESREEWQPWPLIQWAFLLSQEFPFLPNRIRGGIWITIILFTWQWLLISSSYVITAPVKFCNIIMHGHALIPPAGSTQAPCGIQVLGRSQTVSSHASPPWVRSISYDWYLFSDLLPVVSHFSVELLLLRRINLSQAYLSVPKGSWCRHRSAFDYQAPATYGTPPSFWMEPAHASGKLSMTWIS